MFPRFFSQAALDFALSGPVVQPNGILITLRRHNWQDHCA